MSKNSASVLLDVDAGKRDAEQEEPQILDAAESGETFRILILGDFGGGNRGEIGSRSPRHIDRDNFDQVLAAANVCLRSGAFDLKFSELEDFAPDAIFERCDLFRGAAVPAPEPEKTATAPAASFESDLARLTSGSLLDEIVEQSGHSNGDDLQSIVERVTAPHLVRHEDRSAEHEQYAQAMRAILHDPRFQAIESAWRALDFLVRGLDTDDALRIFILDVSKAELAGGLDHLNWGNQPWAVIAGNYSFDASSEDAKLLERIAAHARAAGAPWIAEGAPPDEESQSPEWQELRASPAACWIGLALPRFLARMPYGRQTYAIDSFPFEEIPGKPEHRDYLWANPAFACALLLGRAFNQYGWSFRPDMVREIRGLAFHTCELDGETRSQPCAEVLLTDHEIEFIQEQGMMALAARKNSDVAMIARFQSIAQPAAALAGRWK